MFDKAGEPGWATIDPNLQRHRNADGLPACRSGDLSMLIPLVNIIPGFMMPVKIAERFGKGMICDFPLRRRHRACMRDILQIPLVIATLGVRRRNSGNASRADLGVPRARRRSCDVVNSLRRPVCQCRDACSIDRTATGTADVDVRRNSSVLINVSGRSSDGDQHVEQREIPILGACARPLNSAYFFRYLDVPIHRCSSQEWVSRRGRALPSCNRTSRSYPFRRSRQTF